MLHRELFSAEKIMKSSAQARFSWAWRKHQAGDVAGFLTCELDGDGSSDGLVGTGDYADEAVLVFTEVREIENTTHVFHDSRDTVI